MPLVAPDIAQLDQHLEKHWPGGVKIKMTLESAEPNEKKRGRWRMVKPMLALLEEFYSRRTVKGFPIIAQPRKERKIREYNTDMMETRAARVEQNSRHKAEPSTLYQVYRCIN